MNVKLLNNVYNIFLLIITIILLIYIFNNSFHINLCDSGSMDIADNTYDTSFNENNQENNRDNNHDNDYTTRDFAKLQLADRLRRRISWYTNGKFRGNFNSYEEFKNR
jgi:hypothetical protein